MPDVNEIRALKASLRGALEAAAALTLVQQQVEGTADDGEMSAELLDEMARVSAAQAVAAAALRGLVGAMQTRRGANASA